MPSDTSRPNSRISKRRSSRAEEQANDLEYDLFCQLSASKLPIKRPHCREWRAYCLSLIACSRWPIWPAAGNTVRPKIVDSDLLMIEGGRHPVLDVLLPPGQFVPNDTRLGGRDGHFTLITGPNMAGKSTYIRQVALITLLAQIGSFVPARTATIGLVDRIFTRVGASDELSRGQSTFLVEMTETANILNNATERSLVILDELGRGTSTYDGVSLAWAIAEHMHDNVGCRTLFASHYHELIELEKTLTGMRNRNIAVREWKDEVIFLHQIVDGATDRSYGIHVARLAGIPQAVLRRAQEILEHLELDPFGESAKAGTPKKHRRAYHQLSLFPSTLSHPILDQLRKANTAALSGDKAVKLIEAWQKELAKENGL